MATLPQLTLHFNHQIKLSNDGGSNSSDTGEFVFKEFDKKICFSKTLAHHLRLKDTRDYFVHSNGNLLRQKIYQMIAGNSEDNAVDQLTDDPVWCNGYWSLLWRRNFNFPRYCL